MHQPLLAPDPGWDWGIAHYAKLRRSQGPDHAGLLRYSELLAVLVPWAPSCLPSQVVLRGIWLALQTESQIQDDQSLCCEDWADRSASRLKLMMKHLKDISTSGSKHLCVGLEEILSKVVVPERPDTSHPPTRALHRHISTASSDSCRVCSMVCNCPACRKPVLCDDSEDSCDLHAASSTDHVPCGRGEVAAILRRLAGVEALSVYAMTSSINTNNNKNNKN